MSVWQTPQPATSIITSSGESSPGAASVQSNWPLATNVSPLPVAGAEHALCAGRAVVIGILLAHNSNDRSKTMSQGYLRLGEREVMAITSACDLTAGERAPQPGNVNRIVTAVDRRDRFCGNQCLTERHD